MPQCLYFGDVLFGLGGLLGRQAKAPSLGCCEVQIGKCPKCSSFSGNQAKGPNEALLSLKQAKGMKAQGKTVRHKAPEVGEGEEGPLGGLKVQTDGSVEAIARS
jgi:hypothetical protein